MVDLTQYKTDIFPAINDTPRAPTASLAGNGADLIAKLNGVIDYLIAEQANLSDTWVDDTVIYLSTVIGDDANDGLSVSTPKATVSAAIALIGTKFINNSIILQINGEVNETLDFSRIWSNKLADDIDTLPQIQIISATAMPIRHSGQIVKINPLSPLEIKFTNINFFALDGALYINDARGYLHFNNCDFFAEGAITGAIVSVTNSKHVDFSGAGSFDLNSTGATKGLTVSGDSVVFLDGYTFNDLPTALEVHDNCQVLNHKQIVSFNNCTYSAKFYSVAQLRSKFPDYWLLAPFTSGGGSFNNVTVENFTLSAATDTTIGLFTSKKYSSRKIFYFESNNLPSGTTLTLLKNGTSTGRVISNPASLLVISSIPMVDVNYNDVLSLQITGSIPDNTVITVGFLEIFD